MTKYGEPPRLVMKSVTICCPAGVSVPLFWFQLPYQIKYTFGVAITGPPWLMMGERAVVPPAVGAAAMPCGFTRCEMTSGAPISASCALAAANIPHTPVRAAASLSCELDFMNLFGRVLLGGRTS